jgi:hypothetical protein
MGRHIVLPARRIAVTLALVLGLLMLTGAAARADSFRTTSAVNGFNIEQMPAVDQSTQLAAAGAQGIQVVRSDAPWSDIQPNAPTATDPGWQWGPTDAWVTALASHGLTWEPILDYAVGWAKSCTGFCAPDSDATYAAYAQAVAARYGAGGAFWAANPGLPYRPVQIFEVWNEENVSTYYIAPARYATLYAAARTAIHGVDPAAAVIVGGLGDDGQTFDANADYPAFYVKSMFAADPGLAGNVDGFGLHPYALFPGDVAVGPRLPSDAQRPRRERGPDRHHRAGLGGVGSQPGGDGGERRGLAVTDELRHRSAGAVRLDQSR